jgi:hypothetical protein
MWRSVIFNLDHGAILDGFLDASLHSTVILLTDKDARCAEE